MKVIDNFMTISRYEAPEVEFVDVVIERGFEASLEAGFEGPSYEEEDVVW